MKNLRIAALALCVLLCLSSCSFINEMKEESQKITEFAEQITVLVKNPTVEKAEELVHPESPLTPENVVDMVKNNEKLSSLDLSQEITLGDIGDIDMSYHDETLGGNVYTVECRILVGDTPVDVLVKLLSNDRGFGIYDLDIK